MCHPGLEVLRSRSQSRESATEDQRKFDPSSTNVRFKAGKDRRDMRKTKKGGKKVGDTYHLLSKAPGDGLFVLGLS